MPPEQAYASHSASESKKTAVQRGALPLERLEMTPTTEPDFLLRRAHEEQALAKHARGREAKIAHETMAQIYASKLAGDAESRKSER